MIFQRKHTTSLLAFATLCAVAIPICHAAAEPVVTRRYQTDNTSLTQGMLVDAGSTAGTVVVADAKTDQLLGVVVGHSLIELSRLGGLGVDVAGAGLLPVYVSDINGPVKVGDKITVSPIQGIGMKAGASAVIIGQAAADLSSVPLVTKSVKATNGSAVTTRVGLLSVHVAPARYEASGDAQAVVPFPLLQGIADSIAGKRASASRILLALAALLLGFGIVFAIVHAAIRNGVVAIGRNPLAQGAVRKGMIDAFFIASGVLTFTTAMMWVILRI